MTDRKKPPAAPAAGTPRRNRTTPAPGDRPKIPGELYFMRRPGSYAGTPYDRDQVITLQGQPNDERLVRLGFVAPLDRAPVTCGECGAAFRSEGARDAHGAKRHRTQPDRRPTMAPRQPGESQFDYDRRLDAFQRSVIAEEESREQAAERELERAAPLNWENTEASRREADL